MPRAGPGSGPLTSAVGLADTLVARIGQAVAWLCLGLVLLVAFNVLARYVLAYGTVATQELEWHLVAVIALIGMSYGLNCGDVVRVDVVYGRLSAPVRRVVDIFAALLGLAVAVLMVVLSLPYVAQSYALGEGSPDPGGLPYRYALKALIPLGFALLGVQALIQAVRLITPAWRPPEPASREASNNHGQ